MGRQHPTIGHGRSRSLYTHPKSQKRKYDEGRVEDLNRKVAELELPLQPPPALFADLPLSPPTQSGLSKSHFKSLTAIQARVIPPALKSNDILGAAKTGSGKTLAFVVPVLENLYRKRWTEYDGLGALILSPTRELAIQIFEVLRKVGRCHTFSAGLVIGGKSLREERERLGRMNILIATPGRVLQHMDQTAEFEVQNLQIMVLDEADRIMDMGFQATVDAIVEHLPKDRQSLLFSATQTKKVSDLARLSMRKAEFISAHEGALSATPSSLQQNYVVTPLPEKVDTLWSFVRANVKKKILVFLSSGKQVRYIHEAFRHLQPGIPLLQLHGRQKQTARLDITSRFVSTKYACLFATDVAARGLDFPAVDWVVQVDCPEDAETYIHRVGRTARYEREGQAVLLVDPSEEKGMAKALERTKVAVEKISVRPTKMQTTIKNQLQNMCFKNPELKYLGQKCFVSYVRSVYVQRDKSIFNVKELDLHAYAASLGLPGTPNIKFVNGADAKTRKNAPRQLLDASSGSDDDHQNARSETVDGPAPVRTKYDRMFERQNQDILSEHYRKMIDDGEGKQNGHGAVGNLDETDAGNDENEEFLSVKRRYGAGDHGLGRASPSSDGSMSEHSNDSHVPGGLSPSQAQQQRNPSSSKTKKALALSSNPSDTPLVIDSKRREKLLRSKKKLLKYKGHGSHLHFDSDDDPHEAEYYEREEEFRKKGLPEHQREAFLREEKERTRAADLVDKETAREKRRRKKEDRKRGDREREMESHASDRPCERVAILAAPSTEQEHDNDDDDDTRKANDLSPSPSSKHPTISYTTVNNNARTYSPFDPDTRDQKRRRIQQDDSFTEQTAATTEDLEVLAQRLLDPS